MTSSKFDGFQEQDFEGLADTNWRNRDRLGGVLSERLSEAMDDTWESWAVAGKPELHLGRPSRYEFDDPRLCARLFVSTQRPDGRTGELAYGISIECPPVKQFENEKFEAWRRMCDGLAADGPVADAIQAALVGHDMELGDYTDIEGQFGALGCLVRGRDGELEWTRPEYYGYSPVEFDVIRERIADMRDGHERQWAYVYIMKRAAPEEAMERGAAIVDDMIAPLRALVPVYELVSVPSEEEEAVA